jgi:hypothetical protein
LLRVRVVTPAVSQSGALHGDHVDHAPHAQFTGQLASTHAASSLAGPTHATPPLSSGDAMRRERDCTPSWPQTPSQGDQAVHAPHTQSTRHGAV